MLESLARWSYKRRWVMVGIWIAVLVGVNMVASKSGGEYANSFSLPGSDSQAAYDLLEQRFPGRSGDTAEIVFQADEGVTDPGVQARMESLLGELAQLEHVVGVVSPYAEEGASQISQDGRTAYASVQFDLSANEVPQVVADELRERAAAANSDGLTVAAGGNVVIGSEFEEPGAAEVFGLVAAMIILLVTFGSVLAMGLPIMTALFGIGISMALILLFARVMDVPDFTPNIVSMIGIGVGIDYALFIVTRYRQNLARGMDPEAAVVKAMTTSGRAVVFAGITVVISLLGILFSGFKFTQGLGVGSAAGVAVTMLAAITLLPAVLGFVGKNIDRLRVPKLHRKEHDDTNTFWHRWSRVIQRRPAPVAIAGLGALILLALPILQIDLGMADAGSGRPDRQSRQAYDLLSDGFGPGFNGPLLLVADLNNAEGMQELGALQERLSQTPGVAFAAPAAPNEGGNAALMTVIPTTSPQSEDTDALVRAIRQDVIPEVTDPANVEVHVGGFTASIVDFADKNSERLPILIGVIILLSFLLLVAVFRSILVPLKAAIMNLLSIGAAYGVIVAVFQWGWGKSLIGVETTAPIEAWAPMMLFTILFGLSMDYEIFLLSRIREEHLRTGDNATAVANGLANTARVITAAGAIMVTVFLTFVFGFDERAVKLMGLGLAVAIFVDATLVRLVLVPATMELLGEANWWFPKWLERLVPRINVEGEDLEVEIPDVVALEPEKPPALT